MLCWGGETVPEPPQLPLCSQKLGRLRQDNLARQHLRIKIWKGLEISAPGSGGQDKGDREGRAICQGGMKVAAWAAEQHHLVAVVLSPSGQAEA